MARGLQTQVVDALIGADDEVRFEADVLRLHDDVNAVTGGAAGHHGFKRPTHGVAHLQRIDGFTDLQGNIGHIQRRTDDRRLAVSERKFDGAAETGRRGRDGLVVVAGHFKRLLINLSERRRRIHREILVGQDVLSPGTGRTERDEAHDRRGNEGFTHDLFSSESHFGPRNVFDVKRKGIGADEFFRIGFGGLRLINRDQRTVGFA